MPKTWAGVQKKLGLEDFGPRSQDLGALELIRQRGALNDVLNGDFGAAISKLGKEWASLPSSTYPQHKRSAAWVEKALGMALPGLGSSHAATNATAPGKAVGGPVAAGNQQGDTQMAQAQENAPEASVANPMVDMAQVMGMDPVAMLASLGSGATTLTPNQQLQYLAGLQNDAALVQLAQMGQA